MKATPRARDSRAFTHSPGSRLSIDPDHHVTEAIGDMYGDFLDDSGKRFSYIQAAPGGEAARNKRQSTLSVPKRGAPGSGGFGGSAGTGSITPPGSPIRATSPSVNDAATKPYPLNDIDYESDPVAVAQEISNLQALRRMSMDVTSTADPDLPSFTSFVPSTPPDDTDPGSVFWVPARLHPELAPQEFSAYLEAKKNEIRRPARGDSGSLSPDSSTGPSLRRKKSMLSRQIEPGSAGSYRDGAERLEKRKSLQGDASPPIQLDDFMKDPTVLMHKLSVDSRRRIEEGDQPDDVPIVFAPKVGLKRSTATHYRRGSLRRGERVNSKRIPKAAEGESDTGTPDGDKIGFHLNRVSTEPVTPSASGQKAVSGDTIRSAASLEDLHTSSSTAQEKHKSAPPDKPQTLTKGTSRSRTSEPPPPVPQIIETPPPPPVARPERRSSYEPPAQISVKKRTHRHSDGIPEGKVDTTAVIGDAKGDKKVGKRLEPSGTKERKTSWGFFFGDSEKAKEKEEQKEREREERAKAKKEKRPKSAEKHDNTRLDVLQKSIELGNTGKVVGADPAAANAIPDKSEARKSRSEEKKEKEKDTGFLSFFGGSKKKSTEGAASEKKGRSSRGTSPDPQRPTTPQPYYYTRFPIHIERAIYRLSHLKLANPRRPLHQQVLLSNFMYSYLAKVQQTQPHLIQQATVSPSQQQKQQQAEQQRQQEQQRWQQRQEEQNQYADQQRGYYDDNSQNTEYVDDSQNYEYDESDDRPRSRQAQRDGNGDDYHRGGSNGEGGGYYQQQQQQQGYSNSSRGGTTERSDMW